MMKTAFATVHGLLEQRTSERPQDIFLYFEDQRFTFADIEQSASRVACGRSDVRCSSRRTVAKAVFIMRVAPRCRYGGAFRDAEAGAVFGGTAPKTSPAT